MDDIDNTRLDIIFIPKDESSFADEVKNIMINRFSIPFRLSVEDYGTIWMYVNKREIKHFHILFIIGYAMCAYDVVSKSNAFTEMK